MNPICLQSFVLLIYFFLFKNEIKKIDQQKDEFNNCNIQFVWVTRNRLNYLQLKTARKNSELFCKNRRTFEFAKTN